MVLDPKLTAEVKHYKKRSLCIITGSGKKLRAYEMLQWVKALARFVRLSSMMGGENRLLDAALWAPHTHKQCSMCTPTYLHTQLNSVIKNVKSVFRLSQMLSPITSC